MSDWYAVRARAQAEGKVAIGAEARGLPAFLPVELVRRDHRSRMGYPHREVAWRPLFARYLFVRFEPERDLRKLLELDGVEEVLRPDRRLCPIPEGAIEAIRKAQNLGAFDRREPGARFQLGDEVRIASGPFAGLIATVRSARASRRVEVLVAFVHHLTIDGERLEKMSA